MFTNVKKTVALLGVLAFGLYGSAAMAGDWTRSLNGDNDTTVAVIDALNKAHPVSTSRQYVATNSYEQRNDNRMTTDVIDSIDRSGGEVFSPYNRNFAYTDRGDNEMTTDVIDAIDRDTFNG